MSLVGIDIGSSAVKAAAYDTGGALLAQATEAVPSLHPGPGLSEVDGDGVWKAVVAVVQQVTTDERVRRDPPAALAVSASGREGFPARADGSALGPCLRTADARRPETEAALTLKRSSERWIRDCGHVPDHMDPANRILWWAEQAPRTMSRARWFLGWHELVSLRLTGRPTVDPALASGFLIFDLATGAWSAERIGRLGLDPRPHLSGAPGPWPDSPGSAGAVSGLTLATTGADLVRAALEGIAIDLVLAIEALRAGGSQIQTGTVTGGGARSSWWMQLKADLLGMPVEVSKQAEPGTLGAALLAGVGAGVYGSLHEAATRAGIARRFEPDERRAARYATKVARHRRWAAELLAGPRER